MAEMNTVTMPNQKSLEFQKNKTYVLNIYIFMSVPLACYFLNIKYMSNKQILFIKKKKKKLAVCCIQCNSSTVMNPSPVRSLTEFQLMLL